MSRPTVRPLTLEELMRAAAATPVTEETLAALRQRMAASEREFVEKARAQSQSEFLNRPYSI